MHAFTSNPTKLSTKSPYVNRASCSIQKSSLEFVDSKQDETESLKMTNISNETKNRVSKAEIKPEYECEKISTKIETQEVQEIQEIEQHEPQSTEPPEPHIIPDSMDLKVKINHFT